MVSALFGWHWDSSHWSPTSLPALLYCQDGWKAMAVSAVAKQALISHPDPQPAQNPAVF